MNKIKKSVVDVALEDLNDAPNYVGASGKIVSVKNDESGMEYAPQYKSELYQNAIINGNMEICQRKSGTPPTFTAIANGEYSLDRWVYYKSGIMAHTITQDTDIPNSASQHSFKLDCILIDADIVAGEYCIIRQMIEGYNFFPYIGKDAVLSFWVKATKTGTYCISFGNYGSDRYYVAEYSINTTLTWEKKEIPITFDYSGGDWNYTNNIGLRINFMIACGSTYHTTPDVWQVGTYFATSNQVNGCDSDTNNFWLSQAQLNEGDVALPFDHRYFSHELKLCQRYYCKTYDYDVDPGTADLNGMLQYRLSGVANADHVMYYPFRFPVSMRIAPTTVTVYATDGTINELDMMAGNVAATVGRQGTEGAVISGTNGAVSTTRAITFQATSDAEL